MRIGNPPLLDNPGPAGANVRTIAVYVRHCGKWLSKQWVAYRQFAPLVGLAYAIWRRRIAAAEVRHGRFMQQCTVLFVDVEGLRLFKSFAPAAGDSELPPSPSRVTVPTLFSRTLRALMFENRQMAELVSQAAKHTTREAPILELGSEGWLVMANINAHLMEIFSAFGHAAAACGRKVELVEVLYALVNDRATTSRQQLRVYVVRESQLRALPASHELDLSRGSRKSAYSVVRAMASAYHPPPENMQFSHGITTGLPSGMGRTWLVFPKEVGVKALPVHMSAL